MLNPSASYRRTIVHGFSSRLTLLPVRETFIGLKPVVCFDNDPQ